MTHRFNGLLARFPIISAVILLALAPGVTQAYVGPGVGLSALGSVLAFIGAVFLLIVGFLWYPIKRLLRKPSADIEPGDDQSNAAQRDGD